MAKLIEIKGAAKGALLGGFAAGAVCIGFYFAGAAAGATFHPKDPAAMGGMEVLPFFQPMVNCLIAGVLSLGVVALLGKVAPGKAWSIYLGIAVVVFLIEAYMPFWAFDDLKTIVTLELMHLPPTVLIVGGIARFGLKPAA